MDRLVEEKIKMILARREKQKEETNEFNRMLGKHLHIIVCAGHKTCNSDFDLRRYNEEVMAKRRIK